MTYPAPSGVAVAGSHAVSTPVYPAGHMEVGQRFYIEPMTGEPFPGVYLIGWKRGGLRFARVIPDLGGWLKVKFANPDYQGHDYHAHDYHAHAPGKPFIFGLIRGRQPFTAWPKHRQDRPHSAR